MVGNSEGTSRTQCSQGLPALQIVPPFAARFRYGCWLLPLILEAILVGLR